MPAILNPVSAFLSFKSDFWKTREPSTYKTLTNLPNAIKYLIKIYYITHALTGRKHFTPLYLFVSVGKYF